MHIARGRVVLMLLISVRYVSYWHKFTATFLWNTVYYTAPQKRPTLDLL